MGERRKEGGETAPSQSQSPGTTVIVPTYNEADTVERIVTRGYEILLEVFSKGKYAPGRVREVLHVFPRRERGESKLTPAEYKDSLGHLLPLRMHDR